MPTNAELMREFSRYRQLGLLNENEFWEVSQYLLDEKVPAPAWMDKLANACRMAFAGQIDAADFEALKGRFFQNMRAGKRTVIHKGPIPVHPVGVDAAADEASGRVVRNCAMVAAFIGLIPLPVADAPFLIVTQYVMLKNLCAKYGRSPGLSLSLIVFSALLGPVIFNALVKRIPLAGSIIGACVAAGFTWFIGAKVRAMLMEDMDFNVANFLRARLTRQ